MQRVGDSYSRNKKAISDVIATILIVMITVLAIGVVWIAVLPMVRDNLGSSDVCKDAGISIISSQGYTCYKPNNITMVQVSKGSTKVNVTGLTFSVSSNGNSYDYNNQKVAYSTEDYDVFYLNTSEFAKIEKVSVAPIINLGNSEKSCSVISLEDVPLCSANINLVAVSSGKLISRSSGYSATVPIVPPACIPDCSCNVTTRIGKNCTDTICNTVCQGTFNGPLEWSPTLEPINWTDAKAFCENLSNGYERLPSLDELTAGLNYQFWDYNGDLGFEVNNIYWSNYSTMINSIDYAIVSFSNGNSLAQSADMKSNNHHVRCVR